MNARRIPLIVGILLALGTGVLLLNYLGSLRAATPAVAMKTIVLAAIDIPARAQITAAMVRTTERPATNVDPDSLVDPRAVVGKYSLITIPAGSVLTATRVGSADAFALPSRLPIGMRAVSISIDRVKGVAGLIQPGDRVDVIAVPARAGNETPRASAILRGVLVLAMGSELETARATPSPDNQNLTTVTLALTPKQVDLLAAADTYTTLRLALRPPKEPIRAFPAEPLTLGTTAPAPIPAAAAPPATVPRADSALAATPATAMVPKQSLNGVVVIDGDRIISSGQQR
jgi:pilus assembly protein CpaB